MSINGIQKSGQSFTNMITGTADSPWSTPPTCISNLFKTESTRLLILRGLPSNPHIVIYPQAFLSISSRSVGSPYLLVHHVCWFIMSAFDVDAALEL